MRNKKQRSRKEEAEKSRTKKKMGVRHERKYNSDIIRPSKEGKEEEKNEIALQGIRIASHIIPLSKEGNRTAAAARNRNKELSTQGSGWTPSQALAGDPPSCLSQIISETL